MKSLRLLIPLAVVVLWVVAARQSPARYRLTVDANGDPVRERL